MSECFLHGQGGAGERKIRGWKTGTTADFTIPANTTTAAYVISIEAEGEVATFQLRMNERTSNFFADFANGYYLGGLYMDSTDAANVTRKAIGSDGRVEFLHDEYASKKSYYYIERNSADKKKLDVYATWLRTDEVTTSISYEISYY